MFGLSKRASKKLAKALNGFVTLISSASIVLSSVSVSFAQQIIVDPSAPGTSFLATGNGTPQVNIATPQSGVSVNQFGSFNVDAEGLVLNNSKTNGVSVIGQNVTANPNLMVSGPATTIVNEVTGAAPSSLVGKTEVFGQAAAVIIANPNGISCNGCEFLNSTSSTLTTGKPIVNGARVDLLVEKGTVTVGPNGFKPGKQGGVFGRHVVIDGPVATTNTGIANSLVISGGAQRVQGLDTERLYRTPTVAAPSTSAKTSPFAVDITENGKLTAGELRIRGNEAGQGVNLYGDIKARAMSAASAGNLFYKNIDVRTWASLQGRDVRQYGDLTATRNIEINSDRFTLYNGRKIRTGTVGAGQPTNSNGDKVGNVIVRANEFVVIAGEVSAENIDIRVNDGSLTNNGFLMADGDLTIFAKESVTQERKIAREYDVYFDPALKQYLSAYYAQLVAGGAQADIAAEMIARAEKHELIAEYIDKGASTSGTNVTVTAKDGTITNAGGAVAATKDVRLTAGADIINTYLALRSKLNAEDGCSAENCGYRTDFHAGEILAGNDLSLVAARDIRNEASDIAAAKKVTLQAGRDVIHALQNSNHVVSKDLEKTTSEEYEALVCTRSGGKDDECWSWDRVTRVRTKTDRWTETDEQNILAPARIVSLYDDVDLTIGRDFISSGSQVSAGKDLSIEAGGAITLASFTDDEDDFIMRHGQRIDLGQTCGKEGCTKNYRIGSVREDDGRRLVTATTELVGRSIKVKSKENLTILGARFFAAADLDLSSTDGSMLIDSTDLPDTIKLERSTGTNLVELTDDVVGQIFGKKSLDADVRVLRQYYSSLLVDGAVTYRTGKTLIDGGAKLVLQKAIANQKAIATWLKEKAKQDTPPASIFEIIRALSEKFKEKAKQDTPPTISAMLEALKSDDQQRAAMAKSILRLTANALDKSAKDGGKEELNGYALLSDLINSGASEEVLQKSALLLVDDLIAKLAVSTAAIETANPSNLTFAELTEDRQSKLIFDQVHSSLTAALPSGSDATEVTNFERLSVKDEFVKDVVLKLANQVATELGHEKLFETAEEAKDALLELESSPDLQRVILEMSLILSPGAESAAPDVGTLRDLVHSATTETENLKKIAKELGEFKPVLLKAVKDLIEQRDIDDQAERVLAQNVDAAGLDVTKRNILVLQVAEALGRKAARDRRETVASNTANYVDLLKDNDLLLSVEALRRAKTGDKIKDAVKSVGVQSYVSLIDSDALKNLRASAGENRKVTLILDQEAIEAATRNQAIAKGSIVEGEKSLSSALIAGEFGNLDNLAISSYETAMVRRADEDSSKWSDAIALQYLASHKDLSVVVLNGVPKAEWANWARNHWKTQGRFEGREVTFDALSYVATYSDLRAAFASTQRGSLAGSPEDIEVRGATHYIEYVQNGSENRPVSFSVEKYLRNYEDVRRVFNRDYRRAAIHYLKYGVFEGRTPNLKDDAISNEALRLSKLLNPEADRKRDFVKATAWRFATHKAAEDLASTPRTVMMADGDLNLSAKQDIYITGETALSASNDLSVEAGRRIGLLGAINTNFRVNMGNKTRETGSFEERVRIVKTSHRTCDSDGKDCSYYTIETPVKEHVWVSTGTEAYDDLAYDSFQEIGETLQLGTLMRDPTLSEVPVRDPQTGEAKHLKYAGHTALYQLTSTSLAAGGDLSLKAGGDILNYGGSLVSKTNLYLTAETDIRNEALRHNFTLTPEHGCVGGGCGRQGHAYKAAEILSGSGMILTAGGDIVNNGGIITAAGSLLAKAEGDIVNNALSSQYLYHYINKKSWLGIKRRKELLHRAVIAQGVISTEFGGLTLDAGRDVIVKGSTLSAGGDINVKAKRDVKLDAMSEELVHYRKKRGFKGLSYGQDKVNWNEFSTAFAQIEGANITISAGRDLTGMGALLFSQQDISLTAAEDITFDAHQNLRFKKTSGWSIGISFGGSGIIEAILSDGDVLEAYVATNPSLAAVHRLATGDFSAGSLMNLAYHAPSLGSAIKNGANGPIGFRESLAEQLNPFSWVKDNKLFNPKTEEGGFLTGITFRLGAYKSKQEWTESHVSQVIAGNDLWMNAGADLSLVGGTIASGKADVDIYAGKNVLVAALADTQRSSSSSWGVSVSFTTEGVGFGADFNRSKASSRMYTNAVLTAGGSLDIVSVENTVLMGANLAARSIYLDAGKDLIIQSRQNTSDSNSFGFSFSTGGSFGLNYADANRNYTDTPTTIIAKDRLSIYTGETTYLLGAGVWSETGNLKLDTGKLVFDNFEDKDKSVSLGVNGSINKLDTGKLDRSKSDLSGTFSYRNVEALTFATVGAGEINVRDLEGYDFSGLNRDQDNMQRVISETDFSIEIPGINLKRWSQQVQDTVNLLEAVTTNVPDRVKAEGKQAIDLYRDAIANGLSPAEISDFLRSSKYRRLLKKRRSWAAIKRAGNLTPYELAKLAYNIGKGEEIVFNGTNGKLGIKRACTSGAHTICDIPIEQLQDLTEQQVSDFLDKTLLELASNPRTHGAEELAEVAYQCAIYWSLSGGENSHRYTQQLLRVYSDTPGYEGQRLVLRALNTYRQTNPTGAVDFDSPPEVLKNLLQREARAEFARLQEQEKTLPAKYMDAMYVALFQQMYATGISREELQELAKTSIGAEWAYDAAEVQILASEHPSGALLIQSALLTVELVAFGVSQRLSKRKVVFHEQRKQLRQIRNRRSETINAAQAKTSEQYGVKAYWVDENGRLIYPSNDGFADIPDKITLKKGQTFDRYGGEMKNGIFVDYGKYGAVTNTKFEKRALPPNDINRPLTVYKVKRPFQVLAGPAVPWFDQKGGGIQYYFGQSQSINYLIENKYIEVIKRTIK